MFCQKLRCRTAAMCLLSMLFCYPVLALAEEGVSDTAILIGQTVGVSGQIAGPVKEMMAGADAYFASVNKNGGVHGRKIELRVLDDQFDPVLAGVNAATLIKKDHVFALF